MAATFQNLRDRSTSSTITLIKIPRFIFKIQIFYFELFVGHFFERTIKIVRGNERNQPSTIGAQRNIIFLLSNWLKFGGDDTKDVTPPQNFILGCQHIYIRLVRILDVSVNSIVNRIVMTPNFPLLARNFCIFGS